MRDPWYQSPHLQNGPIIPGNTWYVVVPCEGLVFTSTNKKKVMGEI